MKKQEVGGVPGNVLGMMADLALKLQNGNITPEQFGIFLKKENPFGKINNNRAELIAEWEAFYRDLGIDCDFSGIRIPDDPGGFNRVIIMAQGITPQSAYNLCAKNFSCWKYTENDLDEVIKSGRITQDGFYAIRIRDRVEADEELKNLSVNDLKQRNIQGITLEERLVYELKFFKESGQHLDIQNWTICAGSRYSDGLVPIAYWCDSRFKVHWDDSGHADGRLRSRQAVS